jgi:hypothetical protein
VWIITPPPSGHRTSAWATDPSFGPSWIGPVTKPKASTRNRIAARASRYPSVGHVPARAGEGSASIDVSFKESCPGAHCRPGGAANTPGPRAPAVLSFRVANRHVIP